MAGKDPDVTRPDALTLAGFAVCALLGGANVVAVRFSNQGLPPFYGAAVRFLAASALLFAYMAVRRVPLPTGAEWRGTVAYTMSVLRRAALAARPATLSPFIYSSSETRELSQRAPALSESIAQDAVVVAGVGLRSG